MIGIKEDTKLSIGQRIKWERDGRKYAGEVTGQRESTQVANLVYIEAQVTDSDNSFEIGRCVEVPSFAIVEVVKS